MARRAYCLGCGVSTGGKLRCKDCEVGGIGIVSRREMADYNEANFERGRQRMEADRKAKAKADLYGIIKV